MLHCEMDVDFGGPQGDCSGFNSDPPKKKLHIPGISECDLIWKQNLADVITEGSKMISPWVYVGP